MTPIFYATLPYISFLLPIVTILAVTLAFIKLSAENELLAFISLQYGLNKIVRPLLFTGFFVFCVSLISTAFIEPWGRYKFKEFLFNQSQSQLEPLIKNQIQNDTFMSNFLGYVFYTEKIDKNRETFFNIMMIPQNRNLKNDFIITSPKAKFLGSDKSKDLKMIFKSGSIYLRNNGENRDVIANFKKLELNFSKLLRSKISKNFQLNDIKSKNILLLSKLVDKLKNDKKDLPLLKEVRYIFHLKISRTLIVFPFVFLGAIFGIQNQRSKKSKGILKALLTILFTYIFVEIFRWGGQAEIFSVVFAAWAPHLTLFFVSLCFYAIQCNIPLWEKISIRKILKTRF